MTLYAPGTPGNGGPNAQQDTTTGTALGTPLNSPPPLVNSWNLSPWTSDATGKFTQAPTLTVNGIPFNSTNPQDYISKLQEIKGQGATGPVDQFISQFQSAFPSNPARPVAGTPATPAAPATTPSAAPIDHPTTVLQPGSTDTASVKALQDYLVAHNYMTAAQAATGPGIYGPQTTAAVLAMQKNLGIDYSSGPGYFGPLTIAALGQTHNATTPVTLDKPAAPGTPAAPGAPAAPGTPGTPAAPAVAPPTTALQPGNTGEPVKQLQNYLVSIGMMTQDQVNTGYGIYGPQTTAAVLALQQKLGIDNTSGPGYFGPKTIAALSAAGSAPGSTNNGSPAGGTPGGTKPTSNDPYAGLDPISKQVKMYTDAATALGLPTIKTQLDKVMKDQADLTNEMNKKLQDTQNNPWLSQGIVDATQKRIKESYAVKLDTLTNLANLYDSMYKQGQAQVTNIVSGAVHDMDTMNQLAQKQLDAAAALQKDNQVVSVGGRELLVNKVSGKTVADLGPSTKTAAGSVAKGTIYSGSLVYTPDEHAQDSSDLNASRGADSYVDPTVYLNGWKNWESKGGTLEGFISTYPPKNYVNPANDWLPTYLLPAKANLIY